MTTGIPRRDFLASLAALPFAWDAFRAVADVPIIDTHIHLFDRSRPQGVNWPRPSDLAPGPTALPTRYQEVVKPFHVVGAIVVEASPWLEDNQWVLDQLANVPLLLGHVGFLDLNSEDFGANLDRFHRNKRYLGIRYSDSPQRDISAGLKNPRFLSNLKLLVDAGLSLDSMMSHPDVLVRLTDAVPSLRVIVPHLPAVSVPSGSPDRAAFLASLAELGRRPQVYMKLSEVVRSTNGKVSTNISDYRDWLDVLWDTFGENRVLYGSDWPNSEHEEISSYPNVLSVAKAYVATKGETAIANVFWKNSIRAYGWERRDASQPSL